MTSPPTALEYRFAVHPTYLCIDTKESPTTQATVSTKRSSTFEGILIVACRNTSSKQSPQISLSPAEVHSSSGSSAIPPRSYEPRLSKAVGQNPPIRASELRHKMIRRRHQPHRDSCGSREACQSAGGSAQRRGTDAEALRAPGTTGVGTLTVPVWVGPVAGCDCLALRAPGGGGQATERERACSVGQATWTDRVGDDVLAGGHAVGGHLGGQRRRKDQRQSHHHAHHRQPHHHRHHTALWRHLLVDIPRHRPAHVLMEPRRLIEPQPEVIRAS